MTEKTAEDYKNLWLEERFKSIDSKLDTILRDMKHGEDRFDDVEGRVKVVEERQLICPVLTFDKRVGDLEKTTEDIAYYKKHPNQLTRVIIGAIVLYLPTLAALIYALIELSKIKSA